MSQNNSNDKAAMMALIENINKVDGFDPAPFAVELTDLNSQETRKRLPSYDSDGVVPPEISGR